MTQWILGVRPLPAALAATDVALVRSWILTDLSTAETLLLHIAATAALGALALGLRRRDRVRVVASLLISLLLGPAGGVALLVADLSRKGTPAPAPRAASRSVPPSLAEALHAKIRQGRRRSDGPAPRPLSETFSSGSLAQQQKAIAAISRSYRPAMLPALRLALVSEAPAVRVQAAAVHAKLRGSFGERAKALLRAGQAGPLDPELAMDAEAVAASGFVDAEVAADLRSIAARVAGAPNATLVCAVRPPAGPLRIRRQAYGGLV